MNLALFDFDGTITSRESISDFLKYVLGPNYFYLKMMGISHKLMAYLLGFIDNKQIKEEILTATLKGKTVFEIEQLANKYAESALNNIIRLTAVERIRWHKCQGDRVIIVSAGLYIYIYPWAKLLDVDSVIAMQLEVENNVLTGKLVGQNCYGVEKVRRLREEVDLNSFKKIYAYGDSKGDKEMLSIADEAFFRFFKR